MDARFGILLLALAAGPATSATVAADALLCESVTELEFVMQDPVLQGKPASRVLELAALTAKGWALREQGASRFRTMRTVGEEITNARAQGAPYAKIAASCVASASPGKADEIERKAISGFSKVRTPYQGRPAELWTFTANLQ